MSPNSSKRHLSISSFDNNTCWPNKIIYGGVVLGSAALYAGCEEHNKGYLLFSIIFLPFFLGSIKRIRKHFRTILNDDKELINIEIIDNSSPDDQ